MTTTKTFASKLTVAFVAAAMIVTAFAPAAQAQTTEDLQQMINNLLAQVAQLQAQTGTSAPAGAPAVCPYTWTRDLTTGSEGADVMKLQQFLNSYSDLRVSATGAGSIGMETSFYGPATAAAVSKMQVMFRAEVLSPNGLVNPTGYFGASSRAKANDLCIANTTPTEEEEAEEDATEEEEEDDSSDMTLRGEANLDNVEIRDGESDIEEGQEDVVIGELTVEFANGDAEISRLDFAILEDGEDDTVGSGVAQPWDAFETFSLWIDGDKIAEVDASDEDDYLDEDDGTFRFSNLNIVAMEDAEVEILIGASMQNNLDADELTDWSLYATEIRFFDADGVATTENGRDDLSGNDSTISSENSADFEAVPEGDGDELELRSSSADPDETTIIVDENDTTDAMFFAFDLDASDSDGDVELNSVFVNVTISTNASSTAEGIDGLVRDFYIEIDGDKFKAESYTGTGTTARVEFDIDGDYVIDAGDRVTVEVFAEFEEMDGNSGFQGTTINGSVVQADIDAEAAEDINVEGSSTVAGEFHPVRSEGISVEFDEDRSETSTNGNTVTFTYVVEVTAVGDDQTIAIADFNDTIVDPAGSPTPTIARTLDARGGGVDEVSPDVFEIDESQTATFTFKVFVTTDAAGDAGLYSITLDNIDGTEVDETLDEVANFSA